MIQLERTQSLRAQRRARVNLHSVLTAGELLPRIALRLLLIQTGGVELLRLLVHQCWLLTGPFRHYYFSLNNITFFSVN